MVPTWLKKAFLAFSIIAIAALLGAKIYENTYLAQKKAEEVARYTKVEEAQAFAPKQLDKPADPLALPDFKGNKRNIGEFRGKYVLLHFWATWCPSCVFEIPSLIKLTGELDPEKIAVVAVSLDEEQGTAEKFLSHIAPNAANSFILLLDNTGDGAESYGTVKLPETYLISPEGVIKAYFIGPREWDKEASLDFFKEFLRKKQ